MSAACFFFLLFGYFLLRPLREAMGVQRSMGDLRWLFVTTCVVSLAATVAFGGVVSRMDRARFIAVAFRVVMLGLAGFAVAPLLVSESHRVYVGYAFYVGLSVVNLFLVSVFWALMADVWSLAQGKRLFAPIGVGGTLGALLGSNFVWWLAERIETWVQIVIAMVAFEIAVRLVGGIDRIERRRREAIETQSPQRRDGGDARAVGGGWIDGAAALLRSPYLLGIGLYIALLAVSNTLIYFTQARLVRDASDELNERVALFAQLDTWTQLATLLVQLFVTARLIRGLGIGLTLALLPMVTLVGFAGLAWVESVPGVEGWRVFAVFAIFNAMHRATRYAVSRPARETLFSVVPENEKYKAKPIVDVFLYRGGDVAGVGVEKAVAGLSLGLMGMAMTAAPLAVLWGGLSAALAVAQQRRARQADIQEIEVRPQTVPGPALGRTGSMT